MNMKIPPLSRISASLMKVMLFLCAVLPWVGELQGAELNLGVADYRNALREASTNVPTVAIFGGNVGPAGNAATPNDGTGNYLIRSAFGQPVQTSLLRSPDFDFGEDITAPSGASLAVAPTIEPQANAIYLTVEKRVIATGSGLVSITWKNANGTIHSVVSYLVSAIPRQPPVRIYHTEDAGNVPTLAPTVDLSGVPQVIIHTNAVIRAEDLWLAGQRLHAKGREGLAVLEYRTNGTLLGLQIVDVRPYFPDHSGPRDIGAYLAANSPTTNPPARTLVTRGLTGPLPYAYQHDSGAQDGTVFAVRLTQLGEDIEVFWKESRLAGVKWPYEMSRHTTQWPANFNDIARRIYHTDLPGGSLTKAPTVSIPANIVPEVAFHWSAQFPENTNGFGVSSNLWLVANPRELHAANLGGRILLHYLGNPPERELLGVQLVEVRSNNPDVAQGQFHIGDRLDPVVANTWDAARPRPVVAQGRNGQETENFVYQHSGAGSPQDGNVYAIRKNVDEQNIEIFWRRLGLANIEWPYEMRRYTTDWPTATPSKYQLYVRGQGTIGPAVELPADLNAQRMEFQEPAGHAAQVSNSRFTTSGAGWSLLRYLPGNDVQFQVVRSVSHHDPLVFNGAQTQVPIGTEIVGTALTAGHHQGPRPGYIHAPEGSRYDRQTYTGGNEDASEIAPAWQEAWTTGQIIPVNTGILEVWWFNVNKTVQWPSLVRQYDARWPNSPATIVIASRLGTGPIDPVSRRNFHYYYQNDPGQHGFNPNDEHALQSGVGTGQGIFALRDDLGTNSTSEPYVLLKYQNPLDNNLWRMQVYRVVAEQAPYFFAYQGRAGNRIQPPHPIVELTKVQNTGVSGRFLKDRKDEFWALAAGADGGTSNIVMRWFYSANANHYFPTGQPSRPGAAIPWLDRRPGGIAGVPVDVRYTIHWPDNIPAALVSEMGPSKEVATLNVGETLISDKRGLPTINGQCSVAVLYQQAVANGLGNSVALIDPLREHFVSLASVPSDSAPQTVRGQVVFSKLPPHLRERLTYDPINQRLKFKGVLVQPAAGEPYLLPNIITQRELATLLDPALMGSDAVFRSKLTALAALAAQAVVVNPGDNDFDGLALTAGFARGPGYVTLAFGNNADVCAAAAPVSLEVVKVGCPLYQGFVRVVSADSPFDEMLTLRFDGDLAGKSDEYLFQWKWRADEDGRQPLTPDQNGNWNDYPAPGDGAVDVTIRGSSPFTLSDNWFTCRYQPVSGGLDLCQSWSEWTPPQLAQGWIKRVIAGINLYDQRFKELGDPTKTINTFVDMLAQAGKRWEGSVPLDVDNIDSFGLIQIYETVFQRGIAFSIEGTPPVDNPAVNKALLLAATRLSDLYMLHGNEAFADAADPTIAISTDDQADASSLHCFMDQTRTLLEEELNLLRGRDDLLAPGVEVTPVYNRMFWNFSGGDGEVAYALNYNIADAQGSVDGVVNEEDAQKHYPNGHGDAWGHYLSAIKHHYRLLRHPNYTWVPKSEAVQIGGVPVTVDFQDERRFARAAAAKARTGAEIVNLTYRDAFSADPSRQWRGYKDPVGSRVSSKIATEEPRAWGVSDWVSRAGQGTFLDWVVGNAIVPSEYQGSYRVTDSTLTQLGGQASYLLSDFVLTNDIAREAVGMSTNTLAALLSMPIRSWTGRAAFLGSLDVAIGVAEREQHQGLILKYAQTNGVSESIFSVLEVVKGNQYFSLTSLRQALEKGVGVDLVGQHFASISPAIEGPPAVPPQGIQKIDRASVVELREIAGILTRIQTEADKADQGLNPLGLVKNMIPFDIDPVKLDGGESHFEQIFDRAVTALNHAITVFNRANKSTQLLRQQADGQLQFEQNVREQERDFQSRLIELFGYPYPGDIGGAGTYAAGYTGADVYHYMYVDPSELVGAASGPTLQIPTTVVDYGLDTNGVVSSTNRAVTYNLSRNGFGLVKPAAWTGQRRAPGEIQMARGELIQSKARFDQSVVGYNNLVAQIEDQAAILQAQFKLNLTDISIQEGTIAYTTTLNAAIRQARERQMDFESKGRIANLTANAIAEALPQNLVVGFSTGGDLTSVARSAIRLAGAAISETMSRDANKEQLVELDQQNTKELNQSRASISLTTARAVVEAKTQLASLEQLIRGEVSQRLEVFAMQETMQQAAGRYSATLARGQRLLEELLQFRQKTAANVQQARYKDMAFRIFRNDALQKYRAQFDLAAAYVFMAARAYDFETSLSETDDKGPGQVFIEEILRTRSIGTIVSGEPQVGSNDGDPGLADPMARMIANWRVLKGQFGFNNQQSEQNRFSLRRELFRIKDGFAGDKIWRETLSRHKVANILDIPGFRRLAIYEAGAGQTAEPGIVIPFSQDGRTTTIETGINFFGREIAGGDSSYSSSVFSTKIRRTGLWFVNYNVSGLANTPRVYLLPVGDDVFRSSSPVPPGRTRDLRYWRVVDQALPIPNLSPGAVSDPNWIPINDTLDSDFTDIRRFADFRAYHDSGSFNQNEMTTSDSRLIGRSVWNTQWLLVIPASTLLSDRNEALERFINGQLIGGVRDGDGIRDILILFQTYATPGR